LNILIIFIHQQIRLLYISPIALFAFCQQIQLIDSKTMLDALRVSSENVGPTESIRIFD